jgi:hypothetical protein
VTLKCKKFDTKSSRQQQKGSISVQRVKDNGTKPVFIHSAEKAGYSEQQREREDKGVVKSKRGDKGIVWLWMEQVPMRVLELSRVPL